MSSNLELTNLMEMLSTNAPSQLAVDNISYTIEYDNKDQSNNTKMYKFVIENKIDGQVYSGNGSSESIENALAHAINSYIRDILQRLGGVGVTNTEEEEFEDDIKNNEMEKVSVNDDTNNMS